MAERTVGEPSQTTSVLVTEIASGFGAGGGTRSGAPDSAAPAVRARVVRRGLGDGGLLGAVLFFCLSLTPSLLPRSWLLQGVLGGLTAALGYGLGASVGWAGCRLGGDRPTAGLDGRGHCPADRPDGHQTRVGDVR